MDTFIALIVYMIHNCMHMSKHLIAHFMYEQYVKCHVCLNKTAKHTHSFSLMLEEVIQLSSYEVKRLSRSNSALRKKFHSLA